MIIRIVKLTMRESDIASFKGYFQTVCDIIRRQPGCNSLQAWQDIHNPDIFFTYSIWDREDDLEAYRNSAFFLQFWKTVKPWFRDKAEVWTFNKIVDLP
ncbi:MAG: antibiotic biosynthesis monooxygenase [Bacteroidota bacterium]|nr:antibiotic biosynthesis monooxygenase [Bacteroidota bacterium]